MATEMKQFEFGELGVGVRAFEKDGEVWFVGKDIADVLGYENAVEALKYHCKAASKVKGSELLGASDYKACRAMGHSHNDAVRVWNIIPERDVYRLIMRSKLPAAEQFEEWVVGTVLPSLRKTGGYMLGEEKAQSDEELVLMAIKMLETKIAAMKPKATYHDQWMTSEGSYTITQVAKKLGMTAQKLNSKLREDGIKFQKNDMPCNGFEAWFKVIDRIIVNSKGEQEVKSQVKVSPEGVKHLLERYQNTLQ